MGRTRSPRLLIFKKYMEQKGKTFRKGQKRKRNRVTDQLLDKKLLHKPVWEREDSWKIHQAAKPSVMWTGWVGFGSSLPLLVPELQMKLLESPQKPIRGKLVPHRQSSGSAEVLKRQPWECYKLARLPAELLTWEESCAIGTHRNQPAREAPVLK